MDTLAILFAIGGAAVGGAASWFAAKARFGREAETLRSQADKAEKARQLATQQWQQARREVDQLQKDIMARGVARPAATPVRDAADEKRERAEAAEAALAAAMSDSPPSVLPTHGFADTQPMTSPGRL
jgi:chromosome segregation ATPase